MASPFGIRFFTSGYEKTSREMSNIEKRAKGISTGFVTMGRTGAGSGTMAARGMSILRSGMSGAMGVMKGFISLTLRVATALGVVTVALGGVGAVLATKFSKGLMATRETFYLIETALTGVVKNAAQVRKISDWAMRYAAQYPAMYTDVMDAMKGLAMMPALKPMFVRGDVAEMEKIMNIVQSLAALDPVQGVKGARLAIREALAGEWRSLRFRFELRPEDVAAAGGFKMEEIRHDPAKAIQALDAFVKLNVGVNTLRRSAESLGVQWGNLIDKYKMWLNTVGQYGVYRTLVETLMRLNDVWEKVLNSEAAKRFGQDISRIFEAIIGSIESILTGIDWEGKGIFGGLIEAGKKTIDKLGALFTDAKEFLSASLTVAILYMREALLFSVKNIFWPVGVEIAKAIGDAFISTMRAHPMITWLASMAAGAIAGGIPGALVAGGVSAAFLAVDELTRSKTTRREDVEKQIAEREQEVIKSPGMTAMFAEGGLEKRMEELIKLRKELVELKKPGQFGGKFASDVETATKEVSSTWDALTSKIGSKLGLRKEIVALVIVEEQMKNVVEARIALRGQELLGTKQQVEMAKSNLDYQERLLSLHEKRARWEADPNRGIREVQLGKEILKLNTDINKEIISGATELQLSKSVDIKRQKEKELGVLKKLKETEVGSVVRFTGAELEKNAAKAKEKQQNIGQQILDVEKQINAVRKSGHQEGNKLEELQNTLLGLSKQKLDTDRQALQLEKQASDRAEQRLELEKQLTATRRQQVGLQNQMQVMGMMRGMMGTIGLGAMDRVSGMFKTFGDWIEKSGGSFGGAPMPGMGGMSWGEGATKTSGIPQFFLRMEEVLKEKLERPGVSLPGQKLLLERLYGLNVEQFQMAKGGPAKGAQFLEANKFMELLLGVETKLQDEQLSLAREQAQNLRTVVDRIQTTNDWLAIINSTVSKTGVPASKITESYIANQNISDANPSTVDSELAYAQ